MFRLFVPLIAATLTAISFSGCKHIEMKDGEVPLSFLDQARKAEGVYSGYIEDNDGSGLSKNLREATMTLKFEGARPVLAISTDIINDSCHSKLGKILSVQVSGLKLKRAAFAFDAGQCVSTEISNRMMIGIAEKPDGKFSLSVSVMTGTTEVATETGTTRSSTKAMGLFHQK